MRTLLACLCLSLSFVACVHPPPNLSPRGQVAFNADQVVVRINELQSAAIQANTDGALDNAITQVVVEFSISARNTLGALPDGWQATVKQAWKEARPKIVTTNPTVLLAIGAVDALIGAL